MLGAVNMTQAERLTMQAVGLVGCFGLVKSFQVLSSYVLQHMYNNPRSVINTDHTVHHSFDCCGVFFVCLFCCCCFYGYVLYIVYIMVFIYFLFFINWTHWTHMWFVTCIFIDIWPKQKVQLL